LSLLNRSYTVVGVNFISIANLYPKNPDNKFDPIFEIFIVDMMTVSLPT